MIIEQCVGVLYRDSFFEMVKAIWAEPEYDPSFCVIVDFRRADLSLLMPEIAQFSQYFIESPDALRGPAAILVSSPRETALSLLFGKKMAGVQRIQVFSTWEAACEFLGFPDLPESLLTPG